jgi:hypothetical protein
MIWSVIGRWVDDLVCDWSVPQRDKSGDGVARQGGAGLSLGAHVGGIMRKQQRRARYLLVSLSVEPGSVKRLDVAVDATSLAIAFDLDGDASQKEVCHTKQRAHVPPYCSLVDTDACLNV